MAMTVTTKANKANPIKIQYSVFSPVKGIKTFGFKLNSTSFYR